ncbi:MAG: MBL fold metallo-hydrolase [Ruthenibacterium sp.]
MIQITTLMDNLNSENKALKAEHGLSFWVQTDAVRFLFDCGAGKSTLENAHKLGIDLATADFTVCSHSHYDHAAGYRDLAEQGFGGEKLYTGPDFFTKKYAFDGMKYTDLSAGFTEKFLQAHQKQHIVCENILQIADGCWLVGNFARTHSFETIASRFVKGNPQFAADDFSDEICLALACEQGLIVLVGCSHPGILNMIEAVHTALRQPVCAVFGGTHLVEADLPRIKATVAALKEMGLTMLGMSHCSGELAQQTLREDEGVKSCHMAVGDCMLFSQATCSAEKHDGI